MPVCGAACYTIMSKMVTHVMLAAATRYRRDARHYALRRVRGVSSAVVTAQRAEAEFGSWMFGDMSF